MKLSSLVQRELLLSLTSLTNGGRLLTDTPLRETHTQKVLSPLSTIFYLHFAALLMASLDDILAASDAFCASPPTSFNRLRTLRDSVGDAALLADAKGAKIIIHADVAAFCDAFLAAKRAAGTDVERRLYAGMSRAAFIVRLLQKRPLAFVGGHDHNVLRDGEPSVSGEWFADVGTAAERKPLVGFKRVRRNFGRRVFDC